MRAGLAAAATGVLLLASGAADAEPTVELSQGQLVYVPAYSQIAHGNLDGAGKPSTVLLSSMLSVRNTDPERPMVVRSVKYYDNDGKLLKEYVEKPRPLAPLESIDFFVEHRDKSGGAGANFLVDWQADAPISPPLIETVNAYFFGTQSMAFTSRGQAVRSRGK